MKTFICRTGIMFCSIAILFQSAVVHAQGSQVVLARDGSTITLEPYAPNIVRVTLSKLKDKATSPPGYGFVGSPSATGWKQEQDSRGDVYASDRLVVSVEAAHAPHLTPDDLQLAKFFDFLAEPRAHITISTPEGKTLLDMLGWSMSAPSDSVGNADILNDRRPTDEPFYRVGATFASPADEHYYGLGQNQEGFLDHRGHPVNCWHEYFAPGGESVCVPFLVSNRGYGLVWDNPSRTTIEAGFNERTKWTSEVGDRVSFFVIAGKDSDEIYAGYRKLTGAAPMLPKAAYGFIQSKQRYDSQDEILAVAKGYRDRHLPADMIVVDFLYYTKMGQMDMDPAKWPDPEAMNRQLHAMGFQSMISIWPRFAVGSRYYEMLRQKGWFEHHADGTPTNDNPKDRVGSDIDTSNPDAARWYWETIRDNSLPKDSTQSGWTRQSPTCLPTTVTFSSVRAGAFTIFIRSSTLHRFTTASGATRRIGR